MQTYKRKKLFLRPNFAQKMSMERQSFFNGSLIVTLNLACKPFAKDAKYVKGELTQKSIREQHTGPEGGRTSFMYVNK